MEPVRPNRDDLEVNSRTDLVQYIYALQDDLQQHPELWDNKELHTYLGALAAFLADANGYYRNQNIDIDANLPSWRLLADCLDAATVYD